MCAANHNQHDTDNADNRGHAAHVDPSCVTHQPRQLSQRSTEPRLLPTTTTLHHSNSNDDGGCATNAAPWSFVGAHKAELVWDLIINPPLIVGVRRRSLPPRALTPDGA